jgi:hypothetical protein
MVRKLTTTLFMSAALIGLPAFTGGCDRTVSETKTVKDGPGGTTVKEESTVKKADGSVETKTETKKVPNP